jgi:hypothetical protein
LFYIHIIYIHQMIKMKKHKQPTIKIILVMSKHKDCGIKQTVLVKSIQVFNNHRKKRKNHQPTLTAQSSEQQGRHAAQRAGCRRPVLRPLRRNRIGPPRPTAPPPSRLGAGRPPPAAERPTRATAIAPCACISAWLSPASAP